MIKLTWREKNLLEELKERKLSTKEITTKANMSKATALKYLEGLKGRDLVSSTMIGPTKLWWATHYCDLCNKKMERMEIFVCSNCGRSIGFENKKKMEEKKMEKFFEVLEKVRLHQLGSVHGIENENEILDFLSKRNFITKNQNDEMMPYKLTDSGFDLHSKMYGIAEAIGIE